MASRTVVIGGLGLGWLLRKVCEKPDVERVIVVEKSQELLDWYGYRLCGRFEKAVEVICDDVYRQMGKHGVATRYLLDIWHLFSGAASDHRLDPFRRKYKETTLGLGTGLTGCDALQSSARPTLRHFNRWSDVHRCFETEFEKPDRLPHDKGRSQPP